MVRIVKKIRKYNIGFTLEYFNDKKIANMDFLRLIKEDCLYNLSKALSIKYEDIGKDELVEFQIDYSQDNGHKHYYGFSFSPKCDMSGIFPSNEISNDFLNDRPEATKFRNALINQKVLIDTFWVSIYTNPYKVLRKNKFYKSLHDEIVAAVWQPSRYLDFQELRDLKERWGEK